MRGRIPALSEINDLDNTAAATTAVDELLLEYSKTRDIELRNRLVEHYLYIAKIVAKKYLNRGVSYDDLFQVASMALVKALERFEPERDFKFQSFATPSVIGEIKNYFRDKTRMLHISRRDSEQLMQLTKLRELLKSENRDTPGELARSMGISVERVLELLEMQRGSAVASLDQTSGEDDEASVGDFVGTSDKGFEQIENREFLRRALHELSAEERSLVYERYWNGLSQKQIAEKLGISQMTVSRIEKRVLLKLKSYAD